LTAYSFSSVRSHLCARRTTLVAPLPIATFSHTPYFLSRLAVLSPATLFPSESLFWLDTLRWLLRRPSFGPDASRSLSVNLCLSPPPSDLTEPALLCEVSLSLSFVPLARRKMLGRTEPDVLFARLPARLGGTLGGADGGMPGVGGALHSPSLIDEAGESEPAERADGARADGGRGDAAARSACVRPGSFGNELLSGDGRP
jgi:hypothetical protein